MQMQEEASPHAPKLWVFGVSAGGRRGGELLRDPRCADGAAGGDAASLT